MFKALGRSEIFDLQKFFNDFMAGLTNQPYMAYSTRDTPLSLRQVERDSHMSYIVATGAVLCFDFGR